MDVKKEKKKERKKETERKRKRDIIRKYTFLSSKEKFSGIMQ